MFVMFYNYDKLFSYPFLIAMVIGERGVGKSFNAKIALLNRFLKNGEQFIYLRRYKTELDSALMSFFDDIQSAGYFEDHDLKVVKSKMITKFKIDGRVCGYAVPMSTANILKSTAFPKVGTILFDEFILDVACGTYKYMKNEPQMLLDIMETVFRLRDPRVIMLGNNVNFYGCPYVAYFDLSLPYNSEFKSFKDGTILVNYIKNEDYRKAKKASKFGKLITGTPYGDYAIDNKSLRESDDFVMKKPSQSEFKGIFVINGENVGVWMGVDGNMYLSNKFDPNTLIKFACDFDDHTESTIFLNARENYLLSYAIKAYKQGWLKFESMKIKGIVLPLINKCIAI